MTVLAVKSQQSRLFNPRCELVNLLQARARSLAGFSEDAGEGGDDGDSASRRSYADDCDEHEVGEEEEEVVQLAEQELLRMLDAQEPSLQAPAPPLVQVDHRNSL